MKAYSENVKIDLPISNNFFSYEKRKCKEIIVPSIKECDILNIKTSKKASFVEIDEVGLENSCFGLEYFIKEKNKEIYIFDNHNHSFYFSYELYLNTNRKYDFIHIDQHKDLRMPEISFEKYKNFLISNQYFLKTEFKKLNLEYNKYIYKTEIDLDKIIAYLYTNIELNVGNFIKPLMEIGVIDRFYCIDSLYKINEFKDFNCDREYILDLDLDFFSKDMDYIEENVKLELVKSLIRNAKRTLIATSPYFIEFDRCKAVLSKIFE